MGTGPGEHLTSVSQGSCEQKSSLLSPTEPLKNSTRGGTCTISSDESLLGDHEANTGIDVHATCDAIKADTVGLTPTNALIKVEEANSCREDSIQVDSNLIEKLPLEGCCTQSNNCNNGGRLPLHIAAERNSRYSEVSTILNSNAAAVSIADPVTGLMPFMLAGVGTNSNLNTVFELLRSEPGIMHCQKSFLCKP